MKTILCYGDSNTWGSISTWQPPKGPSSRFNEETRWGGVLRGELGEGYRVIEEGLCGRTTIYGTEDEPYKNGEPYLLPCLLSHRPIDWCVLMLGSNDLREVFGVTEKTLADGVKRLIELINLHPICGAGNKPPKILLIAPVLIKKPSGRDDFYKARGGERAERLSAAFAPSYLRAAQEAGCYFLDAARLGSPSPADGLHMDAAAHQRLGQACARLIRETEES